MGQGWGLRLGMAALTATGLLLALAATLGPLPTSAGAGASLAIRLPDPVRMLVLALLALSALLLVAVQRPRRPREGEPLLERVARQRSPWVVALVPLVLALAAAAYVAWRRWSGEERDPIERAFTAIAGLLDLLALARKPPTSVPWFDATLAGLLLVLALGLFAVMVLVALAGRLERWLARRPGAAPAPVTAREAADDLADLRAEPDARTAIVRAWRRFERALAGARVPRAPWQTPAEFRRTALARLALPAPAVERLTALLEIARFSDRPLDAPARDAACDALDAVRSALDAGGARER